MSNRPVDVLKYLSGVNGTFSGKFGLGKPGKFEYADSSGQRFRDSFHERETLRPGKPVHALCFIRRLETPFINDDFDKIQKFGDVLDFIDQHRRGKPFDEGARVFLRQQT